MSSPGSLPRVFAIAHNTFREAIRDRVLYLLFVFAVLMIAFAWVLSFLTVGDPLKIIVDVGLASINVFSLLIAIFVGVFLVHKEMDKRSIYTLVAKPIRRWEFLCGKALGLIMTLTINVLLMALALIVVILLHSFTLMPGILLAAMLNVFELCIVVSLVILFSSFSTPIMTSVFTLLLYFVGHSAQYIKKLAESAGALGGFILTGVYYVLPDLGHFNIRTEVAHGLPLDGSLITFSILYALGYSAVLILGAAIIFERRDFP